MKLKLLTLCTLLNIASYSYAVKVLMPSAEVLTEQLESVGLRALADKTSILAELADQEKDVSGIIISTDAALENYKSTIKQPFLIASINLARSHLLGVLLQGDPEALEELTSMENA